MSQAFRCSAKDRDRVVLPEPSGPSKIKSFPVCDISFAQLWARLGHDENYVAQFGFGEIRGNERFQ
jgi:hypothetical protein